MYFGLIITIDIYELNEKDMENRRSHLGTTTNFRTVLKSR